LKTDSPLSSPSAGNCIIGIEGALLYQESNGMMRLDVRLSATMDKITELLHNEGLRSVALVAFGWLLARADHFFAAREQRRKAIACALADLLDMRHQFLGMETIMRELATLGPIPEQIKSQLRVVFDSLLPAWPEVHTRYDQSVTTVAGLDPLLGFSLRSKEFLRPLMLKMHSIIAQDPNAAVLAPIINMMFSDKVEPILDASILTLARKRGPLEWYRVRRALKTKDKTSDEIKQLLEPIKAAIESQNKPPDAPHAPPVP
jgi:hypothetical protein